MALREFTFEKRIF